MKKLVILVAIASMLTSQVTPVIAATVASNVQQDFTDTVPLEETPEASVTPEEEQPLEETPEADVTPEEEQPLEETPEADVTPEEEQPLEETPEADVTPEEEQPNLDSTEIVERTPYAKQAVGTTDRVVRTYGIEQLNEFAQGQVNSYVDPSVIADKQAAIAELEVLTPQSPQPYEVAVVNEANEYFFIEGQPSLEEAIKATETVELSPEEETVVIDQYGMVTYANSNVARVFKKVNGALYSSCDINTDIYRDDSLTTTVGYINQC
ncbi:MAG: hypothetical protein ACRCZG_01625, partial [Culicoidibacterales bacterium]